MCEKLPTYWRGLLTMIRSPLVGSRAAVHNVDSCLERGKIVRSAATSAQTSVGRSQ
jgi:hypothetical protein